MKVIIRTEISFAGHSNDVYRIPADVKPLEKLKEMWLEELKFADISEDNEDACGFDESIECAWVDYDGNTCVHLEIVTVRMRKEVRNG